jgi:hypothetical protein
MEMTMMLMLARCVVDESIANTNTVHEANFVHCPPVHRCKIQHNQQKNKNAKFEKPKKGKDLSDAKFQKLVTTYHKRHNNKK